MIKRRLLAISLLLGVFTFALFWPLIYDSFVEYDDDLYVTANETVQQGLTLDGIGWAFHTFHASNWHPLTWLSHMLDCTLFEMFAGGHHLTNLLFHIANTIILFLLLHRMTGAIWRSSVVAALFAWHPLHVESVAWVAERKDVLSTFFWLLCLWSYTHYAQQSTRNRYLLTLAFFALGLMSKPMLVTLPFVLLLLDYWPLRRMGPIDFCGSAKLEEGNDPTEIKNSRDPSVSANPDLVPRDPHAKNSAFQICWPLLREKIPFFALSVAACIVTILAQNKAMAPLRSAPFWYRIGNGLNGYCAYLAKTFWPHHLAIFYPLPSHIRLSQAIPAALLLASITILFVAMRRRQPAFITGWLWFLGTLVPVIGLVQVGSQAMADRYSYVPLLGVFIIMAWGLAEMARIWTAARPFLIGGTSLALISCAYATGERLQTWSGGGVALFSEANRITPRNPQVHVALGIVLGANARSEEAISHFREALRLWPDYPLALLSLASELSEHGQIAEAITNLDHAVRLTPRDPVPHNNLGVLLAKQGDFQSAIEHFRTAIRLNPDYLNAHLNLAMAFNKQKKTAEAIGCYRIAAKLQPQSPEPLEKLAWLLATNPDPQFRDGPSAVALARRATELSHSGMSGYLDTLAAAYAEAGLFKEAIATGQSALQSARGAGQKQLSSEIQNRLQLYSASKPYHELE